MIRAALGWTGSLVRCCGCLCTLLGGTIVLMLAGALLVTGHGP